MVEVWIKSRRKLMLLESIESVKVTDNPFRAKKKVTDQGGKITHEFKLIKGFTYGSHHHILIGMAVR